MREMYPGVSEPCLQVNFSKEECEANSFDLLFQSVKKGAFTKERETFLKSN